MPIAEVQRVVKTFDKIFKDIKTQSFDPAKHGRPEKETIGPTSYLILRANIQLVEYEEKRRAALKAMPVEPRVPKCIKPDCALLPHQRAGLAWLQHLYSLRTDYGVRGAILANDMGLGKTFQLLALMADLLEQNPNIQPMLVVAPVSLLENWAEETDKFFVKGALPMLTAYDDNLKDLRVPRVQIAQQLLSEGLVKFIKPDWVRKAKVVLTTYETLRNLEFSFAAQK
jgi:SNF2 family DNA or RNA helicase